MIPPYGITSIPQLAEGGDGRKSHELKTLTGFCMELGCEHQGKEVLPDPKGRFPQAILLLGAPSLHWPSGRISQPRGSGGGAQRGQHEVQ